MTTTPLPFDPTLRLALLDTMLRLRAEQAVPLGDEAVSAGMAPALAMLGTQRCLLQLVHGSPWQPLRAGAMAADANDVEAICRSALALAAAIAGDGQPRQLLLAGSAAPAALADDGSDAEEHAAWQPADPIALYTARLLADGVVSPGELLHLHQRALFEGQCRQRLGEAAQLLPAASLPLLQAA